MFTAAEGALAYLAPRDSVMFAYMHQPREIINIATIDVSTPGRVARVGGWKRSGNAELLGRFWPRLLTRKDLYNQAFVATILPGGCGAAATGGLALGVWGWGWPGAAFLALVGIWLILNMVVYSVSNNWERIAAMELDVGHVQEVEEWESYFSDSGKIPNQSIVIAETAARDSVNQRTYQYEGEELFAVRVGDLVMLSTSAWGQILDLRNESRPTLQQPGASSRIRLQEELEDRRRQWAEELPDRLQQWAEEVVQSFPDSLGIDARILRQDPLRSEATLTEDQRYDEDLAEAETWFEIAEGPIRWMHCSDDFSGIFGSFASLFVPDSRIHADFPRISIRLVTEKGIRWGSTEGYFNKVRGFSRRVADTLNGNPYVMRSVLSSDLYGFYVSAEPSWGCWRMGDTDLSETTLSKPRWECFQSIARCLLAMPVPTKE